MAVGNVGIAARLQKEARTTSPLKIFLSRYFYFSMSLLMTGLVVWGFSHTVSSEPVRCQASEAVCSSGCTASHSLRGWCCS